ncbi:ATP-binding protein [Sphaerisporangium sp. NPDC005288]|uniref:ATP-binding protein n=1 Tax=Sphaerisporangium sp. NPDC005288 TaxID=3155114 RepID=UPI0033BDD565
MVRLRVYDNGRRVRVEVTDEGSDRTIPQVPAQVGPFSEGGRGLWLVRELPTAWGWRQEGQGRTVWFDLEP